MDALSRELRLFELNAACDSMNNARTVLEEHMPEDEEGQVAVRNYVFPLLADEHDRLTREFIRLKP